MIKLKICYMSDVHAERLWKVPGWLPQLPPIADVLILAGDISVGEDLINVVARIRSVLVTTTIIVIGGNHEFYGENRKSLLEKYRSAFDGRGGVYFLENSKVEINGITFIGATLWSDLSYPVPGKTTFEIIEWSDENVGDFVRIMEDDYRKFNAKLMISLCDESKSEIERMLKSSEPSKTVVITHFPPHFELANKNYKVSDGTPFFFADCSELINKHKPAYWVYGHNHMSSSIKIDSTWFLSNQIGYFGVKDVTNNKFDHSRFIDL